MEAGLNSVQSWSDLIGPEKEKPYFKGILDFVNARRAVAQVYPPPAKVFEAIRLCPLSMSLYQAMWIEFLVIFDIMFDF